MFVEVKTRRDTRAGRPAEAVDARKRGRIARAALLFLKERAWLERTVRFDVVEVVWRDGGDPVVSHLTDAFRPTR